ncbi:MAG: ABC transporter permease [Halobacteriales archaeon]|nr:ABC transporter permease [Halobacteriales archaeon]
MSLRGIAAVTRLELQQVLVRPLSVALGLFFVVLVGTAGYVGSLAKDAAGGALPGDFAASAVVAFMAFAIALIGPIIPILSTIHSVSEERTTRTIDLLASRPITRRDLLLGKILGRGAHVVAAAVIGILVGAALAAGQVPLALGDLLVFTLLVAMLCMCWVGLTMLASTLLKGSTGVLGIAIGIYFLFIIYGLVLGMVGLGGLAAITNPNTLFLGAVWQLITLPSVTQQGLDVATRGLPKGMAFAALAAFLVAASAAAVEVFHRQDEAGG